MEDMVDSQGNSITENGVEVSLVSPSSDGTCSPEPQMITTSSGHTFQVPSAGGAVSIVQVVPNQSVIQHGQQSVIQTAHGNSFQAVQLSKGNVILLNKGGSVIQSGASSLHSVQFVNEQSDDGQDEEPRKRREILARRPSYRKILNDLSSVDQSVIGPDLKEDESGMEDLPNTITVNGMRVAVVPASSIQADGIPGLQTITMANTGSASAGTIVQYAQGQDGQFFVPVTVSAADLQTYQIRTPNSSGAILSAGSPQHVVEDTSRKREFRLLKNREAARECRRKKKEYIKCLENRVAVLENQNKALIEELKSLKELYCQKND